MPTVSELTVVINADDKGLQAGLKSAEQQVSGFGDSVSKGLGAGLGFGLMGKALELAGSAVGALKGSVIDLNGSLEQSQIAFTTMLGSAEKAQGFLGELQTFAAQTPFEFPDLVDASKRMLAFGFESKQVVPLLTAVGDAVAAVGGGAEVIDGVTTALGQMQAKGKVSAEEMGQLAERGIPAWDMLAKKLGVSVADAMDMVSKGQVKAETFIEAFQEGSAARFGGMMEKQSATWSGALSTISDSLTMATAKAFKPFFDLISQGAVQLSKWVQTDTFNEWAGRAAATIQTVVDALRGLIGTAQAIFSGDMTVTLADAEALLDGFGSFVSDTIESWATTIAGWVDGADSELLDNLGTLLVDLLDYLQRSALKIEERLLVWAGKFVDWVAPKIPPLLEALGGLLLKLGEWVLFTAAPRLVETLLTWGAAFVDWVGPRIIPLLFELGKLEFALLDWIITTALPAIVGKLAAWGLAFLDWVADVVPKLPSTLEAISFSIGQWVGQKVADVARAAAQLGAAMIQGIQDGIAGALGGFWDWLQRSFVDKIPDFVKDLLKIHSPSGVFSEIGRSIVEGLRVGMESRLPSIDEIVSRMVGSLGGASGDLDDWLRAAISITGVGNHWLSGLRWLAMHESTGNPRAVNPQSVNGQHATGLMQTLPSTFAGNRDRNLPNDIFNPIANAVAAIRYIQSRYGSIDRVINGWAARGGYAEGGWAGLHGPELAWLGERGPEYVIPNSALRAGGGAVQTHQFVIRDPTGQTLAEWYVTGRETAIRYGRRAGGAA